MVASNGQIIINQKFGHHEFGLAFEKFHRFEDKLIFAYLQAQNNGYNPNQEYVKMIEEVVYENSQITELRWALDEHGYIDHQSLRKHKIFNSKDTLRDFLFNPNSYVEMGNDNDYRGVWG